MAENFVFVLNPDELEAHFGSWPAKVHLGIHYNSEDDESSFLLFREEEFVVALNNFSKGLPIIPECEGFPTDKISFSTESKIIRMILTQESLPEMASDYSLNFDFDEDNAEVEPSMATIEEEVEQVQDDSVQIDMPIETVVVMNDAFVKEDTRSESDPFVTSPATPLRTAAKPYFSYREIRENTCRVRRTRKFVEIDFQGVNLNVDVDPLMVKYSLDGNSIMIPFAPGETGPLQRLDISEIPTHFLSGLTRKWSNLVYEVNDEGIVAHKSNSESEVIPHQKTWMMATMALAFLSVVGYTMSYATFSSAEKLATEALSVAETVSSRATLQADMNPVYLNRLREEIMQTQEGDMNE